METLEYLKAIIDNAPEGASHYDEVYYRHSGDEVQSAPSKRFGWEFVSYGYVELELTRSLSDIERIIELMEVVEDAAALGFLTPSFDSGVSHKQLCKKYEALK